MMHTRTSVALVLAVLAVATSSPSHAEQNSTGRGCEESGYCSLGLVSPFMGAIHTAKGLRAALEARSYKNEIIVEISSIERMGSALMSFKSLEDLGIEHYMLVMGTQHWCLHSVLRLPRIGCTWYNTTLTTTNAGRMTLVSLRYHIMARAVRLGYNVLVVDTDTVFLHDPYRFLKAWPFSNFTALHQEEVLDGWYTNTGISYVQNAALNGPVAWMLGSHMDRYLRISESPGVEFRAANGFWAAAGDDQDMYNDLLRNTLSGRVAPLLIHHRSGSTTRFHEAEEYLNTYINSEIKVQRLNFDVPKAWEPIVGRPNSTMRWSWLQMPHMKEVAFPQNLSSWAFLPDKVSEASKQFKAIFMGDCPECPLPPDPMDISQADDAIRTPKEKVAWFPHWMAISWFMRGRLGHWDRQTQDPPQSVIAHVHAGQHECGEGELAKLMIVCFIGHCDYDLLHHYFGRRLYYSSTHQQQTPPVLALSPEVDLSMLRSSSEAWYVFHGLAQVAYALGRAVVWPDIPCKASYIPKTPGGDKAVPLDLNLGFLAHGPLATLRCSWDMWWVMGCMAEGRGLYTTEFEHLLSKLPQEQRVPTPNTTILAPGQQLLPAIEEQGRAKAAKASGKDSPTSPADMMVQVDAKGLREAASHLSSAPVLYLAHPVRVNFGAEQQGFDSHWARCLPINRDTAERTCKTMAYGGGDASVHREVMEAKAAWQQSGRLPPSLQLS